MKFQQAEFRIIDSLAEKAPLGIAPDTFLRRTILCEHYVSNQRHAVPTREIANTCFRILFKMRCLAVQPGAF